MDRFFGKFEGVSVVESGYKLVVVTMSLICCLDGSIIRMKMDSPKLKNIRVNMIVIMLYYVLG